jgi:putative MATE family efflux protein
MIWPLLIEQILAVTMGAADTVMVSSVGEFAVSGVNIVDNINNLLIIAFAALAMGGAVVVSQWIGRGEAAKAQSAAKQLVYAVLTVSLGVMVLALIFRRSLISLIYGDLAIEVHNAASTYLLITALSFPALAGYNAAAALFRAVGNSNLTMRIAILVNVLNIGGNLIFIFVLHLGVFGAALATLISRLAAALVSLFLLIRLKDSPVSLAGIFKPQLVRQEIADILSVGIPSGIENSMFQLGRLLTQRIFATFGTAAIAGNAIASVVNSFSFMPGLAYGMTLLVVTGQCVGAGDYAAAQKNAAKILKISYATMVTVSLTIFFFREPIVSVFQLSPTARDYALDFMVIHCLYMSIAHPPSFTLPNALRAAGDARFVMVVAATSMWALRVSLAYFLCFTLEIGPIGVWLAMAADCLSRGFIYQRRWRGGQWRYKRVISD